MHPRSTVDKLTAHLIINHMADYEIIDHTADIGIRVRARSEKATFITAARAMFDIIAQPSAAIGDAPREAVDISVDAPGYAELLVAWLGELLSLSDCRDIIFTDFEIERLTARALLGRAQGVSRSRFTPKAEIKAVTYHGLRFEKDGDGFTAEVIFDV